jgi:hypothetical protein
VPADAPAPASPDTYDVADGSAPEAPAFGDDLNDTHETALPGRPASAGAAAGKGERRAPRFITAADAEQREREEALQRERANRRADRRAALVRAGIALVVMLALAAVGWMLFFKPLSADEMYARIAAAANSNDPDALLDAEPTLQQFKRLYGGDPRAAELVKYEEEIDLRRMERRLRARSRMASLGVSDAQSPLERALLEALVTAERDPERGLEKLQAVNDLFGQGEDQDKDSQRYLQIARRQAARLNTAVRQRAGAELILLRQRLERAEELRGVDPDAAERIAHGVVSLYADKTWAEVPVTRARAILAAIKADAASPDPPR